MSSTNGDELLEHFGAIFGVNVRGKLKFSLSAGAQIRHDT